MMREETNDLQRSLCVAVAGVLAAATIASCSRDGEVQEGTQIRSGRIENTAAADVIAAEGGPILRDIAEALVEVHRDYPLGAEEDIDRADRMLDLIEQATPTADARNLTWVARERLEYAEIPDVKSDLEPIYAAVERIESLAPCESIRGHLDRTQRYLDKGEREAAGRELARVDEELLFVEVDLPVSSMRRYLAEAREGLALDEPDRAAASLERAEDALVFLTGVVRSPLGAARWSLAKAEAAYAKGDTEGAEHYVTLARRSLDGAGNGVSGAPRKTLNALVGELRGLKGQFATGATDAQERLNRMEDRLGGLVHSG